MKWNGFRKTVKLRVLPSGRNRLAVLMYHDVSDDGACDDLTVTVGQLEKQFKYLRDNGYTTLQFSDLLAARAEGRTLPPRSVLITFDDGFLSCSQLAYPLAKKYGCKLNFFVVPEFIHAGTYRDKPCMRTFDLRRLDPDIVQLGLHSYAHDSYEALSPAEVAADIENCLDYFESRGLACQPCLAFPYGAFPRKKGLAQAQFFEALDQAGIKLAFRIGNRLNPQPFPQPLQVQRIDVRGDESFRTFRRGVALGKKFTLPFFPTTA